MARSIEDDVNVLDVDQSVDSSSSLTDSSQENEVVKRVPSTSLHIDYHIAMHNSSKSLDSFNITVETAVFVDESLYKLLSATFPIDTEQQIVLYVLTIMNAVQLLFKQPSIGRSVEISVVLMDLLKQQPKVGTHRSVPLIASTAPWAVSK